MDSRFLFLASFYCAVLCGHGFHAEKSKTERSHGSAWGVEVFEKGSAVAVRRVFSLSIAHCAKHFHHDESYCFVPFLTSAPSHHDFTFPISPVALGNGDEVSFKADERGYFIFYSGVFTKKEEQLKQIEEALRALSAKGIKEITVQLFKPKDYSGTPLLEFKETKLGDLVAVKRKIPIDYSACEKAFETNGCWVNIVREEVPDHPGPAGGGDISKTYQFSETEKVTVSLENLYEDYLVYYEGPETEKSAILYKIKTALQKLKGSAKALSLECPMFTLKKTPLAVTDTLVAGVQFFEVAMPLTLEICKDSLETSLQNCSGNFAASVATSDWDHPGGDTTVEIGVAGQGQLDVYGTYVAANPFWKLHYELLSTSTLTPLEFLEKGFEALKAISKTKISTYGFHAK